MANGQTKRSEAVLMVVIFCYKGVVLQVGKQAGRQALQKAVWKTEALKGCVCVCWCVKAPALETGGGILRDMYIYIYIYIYCIYVYISTSIAVPGTWPGCTQRWWEEIECVYTV